MAEPFGVGKSSAYSKAARMVPTQAAPISAAVQLNASATTCLPVRPGLADEVGGGHPDPVEVHARADGPVGV
jgi:hypothetical protein